MYALVCYNSSGCSNSFDLLVNATSKGEAWNKLFSEEGLKKVETITGNPAAYYFFEVDDFKLRRDKFSIVACDSDHIEFKLSKGSVKAHYDAFCKAKFGQVSYKMTNEQFADSYSDLVWMFVEGDGEFNGCSDDPFKMWALELVELKHYDSADTYLVFESRTHCINDAVAYTTSTEHQEHKCTNADDELCSGVAVYFPYPLSNIVVL